MNKQYLKSLICSAVMLIAFQALNAQEKPKPTIESGEKTEEAAKKTPSSADIKRYSSSTVKKGSLDASEIPSDSKKKKLATDGVVGPKTANSVEVKPTNTSKKHLSTISHESSGTKKKNDKKPKKKEQL